VQAQPHGYAMLDSLLRSSPVLQALCKKSPRSIMSKYLAMLIPLLLMGVVSPVMAGSYMKEIRQKFDLVRLKKKDLKDSEMKAQAAFIYTVLSNTNELRIHQMGGAINNRVFLGKENGRYEFVAAFDLDENGEIIDGTGRHVNDCLNKGSLNYHNPTAAPLSHFAADILPWILWGNCENDPGTAEQRVTAYMLDFKEGFSATLSNNKGFYLPKRFKFNNEGQSETVAFFQKSLNSSGFKFNEFYPDKVSDPESQKQFFEALESGIQRLVKNA
jgi:hypothetical protein